MAHAGVARRFRVFGLRGSYPLPYSAAASIASILRTSRAIAPSRRSGSSGHNDQHHDQPERRPRPASAAGRSRPSRRSSRSIRAACFFCSAPTSCGPAACAKFAGMRRRILGLGDHPGLLRDRPQRLRHHHQRPGAVSRSIAATTLYTDRPHRSAAGPTAAAALAGQEERMHDDAFSPRTVLLTGAAGRIGSTLRTAWTGHFALLRLVDVRDVGSASPGVEVAAVDLADLDAVRPLMPRG